MTTEAIETTAALDYTAFDSETRIIVQQRTTEIKALIKRAASDIIEIGQKLIEVKDKLPHGAWLPWLRSEFAWSDDTARNHMNVARAFSEIPNGSEFDARALYLLAAPSTPESARIEALDRAGTGEAITHQAARQIVAEHRPAPAAQAVTPPPAQPARPAPSAPPPDDEEEIAAAPPRPAPAPPPVLTPVAPAAPIQLTPVAPVAPAAPDLAQRKLLAAKYELLDQALLIVEADLKRLGEGPTIVVRADAAIQAARLFVNNPALNGAASMLLFSTTVEDKPSAPAADRNEYGPVQTLAEVEGDPLAPIARRVADVEALIEAGAVLPGQATELRACRRAIEDLVSDERVSTEDYDDLSARIGEAQARMAEMLSEVAT